MACAFLFCSIAKPADNLALRVFQRYYAELSEALSSCTDEVAAKLYSAQLVTMQERSQAVEPLGFTSLRKAEILIEAVERRIVVENSPAQLRTFCQTLERCSERCPGVVSIVSRLKSRLGESV